MYRQKLWRKPKAFARNTFDLAWSSVSKIPKALVKAFKTKAPHTSATIHPDLWPVIDINAETATTPEQHTDHPTPTMADLQSTSSDPPHLHTRLDSPSLDSVSGNQGSVPPSPALVRSLSRTTTSDTSSHYEHQLRPISFLPIEVLGEIFFQYVHSYQGQPPVMPKPKCILAYKGQTETPVILSQVCRRWRILTRSHPLLWSTIYIYRPRVRDLPLVGLWLEHSKSCPLDVTLVQNTNKTDLFDVAFRDVMMDLASQSHRWKRMTFHILGDMDDYLTDRLPTPNLEGLDVQLITPSPPKSPKFCKLYGASKLRQLSLGRALDASSLGGASWTQIVDVHLHTLASPQVMDIFNAAPNLERFVLNNLNNMSLEDRPAEVTLQCLHTLAIGNPQHLPQLLERLVLPSLSHLRLGRGFGFCTSGEQSWASLSSLIARSKCQLETFFCYDPMFPEEYIMARQFPTTAFSHIRHLTIASAITSATLLSLTHQGEQKALPNLETLTLHNSQGRDGLLSNLVLSRGGSPLRRVYARLTAPWTFDRDLGFQAAGVDLDVDLVREPSYIPW